jgi:L-ascorbate metabolism protein UlaG (beta-lactamase superfamily)
MENIRWLGHATFMITGEKTVYIDPYKMTERIPADIILITHSHFDHCSDGDIRRVQRPGTVIIAPAECPIAGKKTLLPGQKLNIDSVSVEAVPAYNTNKSFHPKSSKWVGYIITINGKRIYHAGDTDFIPEMVGMKDIDIALLPIGGTYTMNPEEAAKAAEAINPKIAIPMHYGTIVGNKSDAQRFKELCKCRVELLSVG